MRALQTIIGLDSKLGGPSTCTYELVRAMREIGCKADLLTASVSDPADKMVGNDEEWIKVVEQDYKTPFAISDNMYNFLASSNYDVYHANTLWLYQSHITCKIAKEKGKPYIISPHGMLYRDALKRSAWKKRIILALCFSKDISNANALHATCMAELEHIRNFGYKGLVAVIPNPITIPEKIGTIIEENPKRNRIGYLGRLHPYKRPDALIRAWAQSNNAEWELVIMGKGELEYENYLRQLSEDLNLKNVTFLGQVSGIEKYETLASCKATCCPSISENFGMSVAESLLCQTPVICTKTAPWEDLSIHDCGWWIENSVESLSSRPKLVLEMPDEQITNMGERGAALIYEKYSSTKVATDMQQLYDWLVEGGKKPEFIYE